MFLVRALDRFYRRIVPLDKLINNLAVGKKSLILISHAGRTMCSRYYQILQQSFLDGILTLRQQIVQQQSNPASMAKSSSTRSPLVGDSSGSKGGAGAVNSPPGAITLSDMLASLEQNVVEKLKSVLTALHVRKTSDQCSLWH